MSAYVTAIADGAPPEQASAAALMAGIQAAQDSITTSAAILRTRAAGLRQHMRTTNQSGNVQSLGSGSTTDPHSASAKSSGGFGSSTVDSELGIPSNHDTSTRSGTASTSSHSYTTRASASQDFTSTARMLTRHTPPRVQPGDEAAVVAAASAELDGVTASTSAGPPVIPLGGGGASRTSSSLPTTTLPGIATTSAASAVPAAPTHEAPQVGIPAVTSSVAGISPVRMLCPTAVQLLQQIDRAEPNFLLSDPSLPDNPIVYVSKQVPELVGYPRADLLGRNMRMLYGPGTLPASAQQLAQAMNSVPPQAATAVLMNYAADGSSFWSATFVAPLFGNSGELLYFVAVLRAASQAAVSQYAHTLVGLDTPSPGPGAAIPELHHVYSHGTHWGGEAAAAAAAAPTEPAIPASAAPCNASLVSSTAPSSALLLSEHTSSQRSSNAPVPLPAHAPPEELAETSLSGHHTLSEHTRSSVPSGAAIVIPEPLADSASEAAALLHARHAAMPAGVPMTFALPNAVDSARVPAQRAPLELYARYASAHLRPAAATPAFTFSMQPVGHGHANTTASGTPASPIAGPGAAAASAAPTTLRSSGSGEGAAAQALPRHAAAPESSGVSARSTKLHCASSVSSAPNYQPNFQPKTPAHAAAVGTAAGTSAAQSAPHGYNPSALATALRAVADVQHARALEAAHAAIPESAGGTGLRVGRIGSRYTVPLRERGAGGDSAYGRTNSSLQVQAPNSADVAHEYELAEDVHGDDADEEGAAEG